MLMHQGGVLIWKNHWCFLAVTPKPIKEYVKYHTFSYLKDRVWMKLQRWKGSLLSKARKEILIKAVAQVIPTYSMGVFLLPVKLCDELNALSAKF